MEENKNTEYWNGVKAERKNTRRFSALCGITALLVGGFVGFSVGKNSSKSTVDPNAQKLVDAYNLIKNHWLFGNEIEDLDNVLVEMMFNGLFDNDNDPYTFYTKDEASQGLDTTGLGFGVSFANYYGQPIIKTLHNGSMAKAGFKANDIIVSYSKNGADKIETLNQDYSETLNNLVGTNGDYFSFEVNRNGQIITFNNVKVEKYEQQTVFLVSDILIDEKRCVEIRINTFLGNPATELSSILERLLKDGQSIDKLLIDIKDNGGGYVDQMAIISSLFVPKGSTIYSMTNKEQKVISVFKQDKNPTYSKDQIKDIRIVQNGSSASASESFTLALKDTETAKVYGTQSFGKGIAQTFYNFKDGSVIRYTYAYVNGPKGYSINKVGITPDVVTNQDYYAIKNTYDYKYELSTIENYLTSQLQYYGYTGDLSTMLVNFQADKSLEVTGTYNKETYNFLAGLNYDTFNLEYSKENNYILSL